ncbi:uncharacterized protein SPPG_02076 [Spizellomyces punctatus DAOM BR117]|uniref:Uncharacterized protein n=1 Tax=Spizellomyces punctatus (strain DAOM BR117) TaxID=645134 RepID=A0A0L0HPW7_SPIPD|nr:uncharacterized protein SPPG_02076 [Spizellomyces punctatus DAOM BR117]KND03005.1 hypothetical protein SPPG_02076 [Spizellomyces punctatus DAOM BR117]|eukprot:XP_016611044.1 hypothetical protein SPPG_02076 [Spizellomyces punctatus DAOM BR117]
MHTPAAAVPPRVLGASVSYSDETERFIAMPAPHKPLALRSLHMLVPRIDTSSPSCKGIPMQDAQNKRPTMGTGRHSILTRKDSLPLSPLIEHVEKGSKSFSFPGDDDAVAELMEIVGLRRPNAPSPVSHLVETPLLNKRRNSSVPQLFEMEHGQDDSGDTRSPVIEPPRLSETPFKPTARKGYYDEPLSPCSELRMTDRSPVSRTRNPIPFNSPFLNRRRMASPLAVSPTIVRREPGVELGLLSPSPELRTPFIFRSTNPVPSRLAEYSCSVDVQGRPRSKSVTDLDGRIRMAFAC